MQKPTLSLQLWSLRQETAVDPSAALRTVASLGFDGVELAGTYDLAANEMKMLLRDSGLTVVGAHVALTEMEEQLEATFEYHRTIGNQRLIVPYLPAELQNSIGYREVAARLNRLAVSAVEAGFEFGYHNHAFEFKPLDDGKCGMDILLAETDASLVRFEFDVFWVEKGGRNAVSFLQEHSARTFMIHAKELDKATDSEAVIGRGSIDFPSVIDLAKKQNWPVVVEFEGPNAPDAVKKGATYIKSLL